ncbi:hypothetical protein H6A03_04250 [[Clostridium] spiroforme]|nr:hypothetical protein [Thomasclavelia spiroformis]
MIEKIKEKIKTEKIGVVCLIYLILLLFSGYYFFENSIMIAILLIGTIVLVLAIKHGIRKKNLELGFLLSFIIILVELLTSLEYGNVNFFLTIIRVIIVIISCSLSSYYSVTTFKKSYVNCMIILSIGSLFLLFLYIIIPSIVEMFPTLINSKGKIGFFGVFSILSDFSMTGIQRNQGIFWEPGAYQFFLSLAYIYELAKFNNKPRKWVLFLFLITIVTTYSTTGFVVGIILLVYTLSRLQGRKRVIQFILVVLVFSIALIYIIPRLTGFMQYTLVTKIEMVLNYHTGVNDASSSRIDSIVYPLKTLIDSPWGIGEAGYTFLGNKIGHMMFTCTPVNWIVKYGPLYGIIVLGGIWKFFKNEFKYRFDAFILFFAFLISMSSEELSFNIIILYMCFKGYELNSRKKVKRYENSSN